jgi:hypothetical protein
VGASTRGQVRLVADDAWREAAAAPLLPYAEHWRVFESMLRDCTEVNELERATTPCFDWRGPHAHRSPTLTSAMLCASRALPTLDALGAPGNGTLAAVVECVRHFGAAGAADRARRRRARARPVTDAGTRWGVLALGDAPGFASLVSAHPQLRSRVVETSAAGAVAHTTFTGSCAHDGGLCAARGTHNPRGGWTRAMVDFYLGGLSDSFVSALFSSFVGAMLRRSLRCCRHRMHFDAMYSARHSHRDRPMRNVAFLRAMMQDAEVHTNASEWSGAAAGVSGSWCGHGCGS